MNQQLIDALLAEKRGYQQRGLKDRVKMVDEMLNKLGHRDDAPIETASVDTQREQAAKPTTRKRASK